MEPDHRWGLNGGNDVEQHERLQLRGAGRGGRPLLPGHRQDRACLRVAVKMANHACDVIGPPPKANVIPGHALAEEALAKLYLLFRAQPELKKEMPVPSTKAAT